MTYVALHGFANKVDAPKTRLFVAGVEGLERVAQVRLGRVAGQVGGQVGAATVRTIPRADDGVGHHERDVVRVGPAATLHRDGDMSKRHVIIADANLGAWRDDVNSQF